MSDTTGIPETVATYLRLRGLEPSVAKKRRRKRRNDDDENQPFTPGRDPKGVGDLLVGQAAGDQPQHLNLARAEGSDPFRQWPGDGFDGRPAVPAATGATEERT